MVQAEDILRQVVTALVSANVDYMLVGSFSSNFYGVPRSTQDVDLVIELKPDQSVNDLMPHLGGHFRLEPQVSFELFTATRKNELTIDQSAFCVELFHLSPDRHDQERFRRRREVQIFDCPVWLPTPEDVIITKLRWLRPKDEEDIQNVISAQSDRLDWAYIEYWSNEHQTAEALSRIRDK